MKKIQNGDMQSDFENKIGVIFLSQIFEKLRQKINPNIQ